METLKEIDDYEAENELSDEQRRALFGRRMQIFLRIHQWREENERLGLEPTISDHWTPQQREAFLQDWRNDIPYGEKHNYDEMAEASTSQMGRGERPYTIQNVKEGNIKKFKAKGTSYTVRFNNSLADDQVTNLHEQLHEIFEQILDDTINGVPPHDQVRLIINSNQLEYPIAFPFMAPERLTSECVLSGFERVIQSNQEFRLKDSVDVNVLHASLPVGGNGTKRANVNLEKHLEKRSLLFGSKTRIICVWVERSWWLKPRLMITLRSGKYEIIEGLCKLAWRKNSTRVPTFH